MMNDESFSKKLKKFLLTGSASLYSGVCPVVLKHIDLQDRSDLLTDSLKTKELKEITLLGFNQPELHINYTNAEWENAIYVVCQFMEKKNTDLNFNCFKECLKNPDVRRESIIFVLAAMTLNKTDKGRHECFLAVQDVCQSTKDFFLFVQLRKLLSVNCMGLASGKGFKKTVLRWYQSFGAKKLLLELVRSPSAFKWRHKDLLTLCHIGSKKLSIEYQVIFHYIFTNAKKTKVKFESVEEAEDILEILSALSFEEPSPTMEQYMTRAKYIQNEYSSSSYLDFPTHCYVHTEMWDFVLQYMTHSEILSAIIYTNLSKILPSNTELVKLVLRRLGSHPSPLSDQMQMIFATNRLNDANQCFCTNKAEDKGNQNLLNIVTLLDTLIMKGMKSIAKCNDKRTYIFINEKDMMKYKKVVTMDSIHNEIRSVEAAAYISNSLHSAARTGKAHTLLFHNENELIDINMKMESFHDLKGKMKYMKNIASVNIGVAISYCALQKAENCIFIYNRITDKEVEEIVKNLLLVDHLDIRIIMLGIEFNAQLKSNSGLITEHIMVINEFSSGTLSLIKYYFNKDI